MNIDDVNECHRCGFNWLGDDDCPRCRHEERNRKGMKICKKCHKVNSHPKQVKCMACGEQL